jgi:hypothetical protein
MYKTALLLILMIFCIKCNPFSQKQKSNALSQNAVFESFVEAYAKLLNLPGIAVGIARGERLVRYKEYISSFVEQYAEAKKLSETRQTDSQYFSIKTAF